MMLYLFLAKIKHQLDEVRSADAFDSHDLILFYLVCRQTIEKRKQRMLEERQNDEK